MLVLIVDKNSEKQSEIARKLEVMNQLERDALSLSLNLSTPGSCLDRVAEADLVIIGAGVGDGAFSIASRIRAANSQIEIVIIAQDAHFTSEAIRLAHTLRVRKVLSTHYSTLDFLQELLAVNDQLSSAGKTKRGKLVVATAAKGGIGLTTLVAALGERLHDQKHRTLLWDLDIESRDLTRGMNASGIQAEVMTAILSGSDEFSYETLARAFFPVSSYTSLLTPPSNIAAGLDLLGHPESLKIVQRIVELSKLRFDSIVVDTAGRLSPSSGSLLRMADEILFLVEDSLIGLSAAHLYLETIKPLINGNIHALKILPIGTKVNVKKIQELLDPKEVLPKQAFTLPPLPEDSSASRWAGSGQTMYGMGKGYTKSVIEAIAEDVISTSIRAKVVAFHPPERARSAVKAMQMIFKRATNS